MRTRIWIAAWVVAAALGCASREEIEVTLASPEGPQEGVTTFARFQLSRPVYDPAQTLPDGLATPKVSVTPKVPFRAYLSGPSTVDVDFEQPLPDATAFTVTLHGGLATADGKATLGRDATARFTTRLNRLSRVELPSGQATSGERSLSDLGPSEPLQLDFLRPVPREQLSLLQVFVEDGPPHPVRLETEPAEGPVRRVHLHPEHGWPRATRMQLVVGKGLKVGTEGAGSLATTEAQSIALHTWGRLAVRRGPGGQQVCADPARLAVEFNHPVRCEEALAHLALDQNRRLACIGTGADRLLRVEVVPALKGNARAVLTVRSGLTDAWGETLEADSEHVFDTCSPSAGVANQTPFVILDPGQAADHVERVAGAARVQVEGRRLPFERVWPVLQRQELTDQVAWTELPWWMEYDYEWYEGERRPAGDMRSPRVDELEGAQAISVPVPEGKGRWRDVRVGLDPFLEGGRGLVLLRVTPMGANERPVSAPLMRLVNVTDIGLSVRASEENLAVLAVRYSDGKPLGGAELTVLDEEGRQLATGRTDPTGAARLNLPRSEEKGERGLLLIARHGGDEAFLWSRFVVDRSWSWNQRRLLGTVYTDRGIYRPGETMNLKAVVRLAEGKGFSSAAGQTVRLRVTDPESTHLLSEERTLSEWGTLTGELPLPAAAKLGHYTVAVELGDERVYGSFQVGEFRRAEMKVEIQSPPHVSRDDTLSAVIQADYLFGAPAAKLDLRWSLTRQPAAFQSKRFPKATFVDASDPPWRWYGSDYTRQLADGRAQLDENGSFALRHALRLADPVRQYERLNISATVEDRNGQTVSRQSTVDLFNAGVLVGMERGRYLINAAEPTEVVAVAVTPDDRPAAGVEVVVLSSQTWWRSVQRAGPGGGVYTTSERVTEDGVERCRGKSDANGRFVCRITPEKAGDLRVHAEVVDDRGRKSTSSTWAWVYDPDSYWGRSDDSRQATLLFESDEIEAGEPVKLAITSPFPSGVALVTVEREDVRWQKAFEMGTSLSLEIPTDPSWAPNVEVVATIVRGRVQREGEPNPRQDRPAYAIGRRKLKVRPTKSILQVKTETGLERLEPGQTQVATTTVTGHDGRPVAEAEVNLWAVDEGVLMLTDYRTPDLIAGLFAERGRRTMGLDTRQYILAVRRFAEVNKGEEEGGGGGDEGDDRVRQNFDPLAVWIGSAVTDAAGRVEARFEVPDNLTTYRLMATAVSKDDRFGSGDTRFKVNKTLMLRQALPRFARPGDRMQAGVLVNHMGEAPATVTVKLDALDEKLFSVSSPREVSFELPPGETRPVLFDLAAADVEGSGKVRFAASMGKHRDRVELEVPVIRIQPRESISRAGVLTAGSFTDTLKVPEHARAVALTVNASSLPLSSMEDRLRMLVQYPYGCLEQRTSRALPLMAVRSLADDLNLASIDSDTVGRWVGEYLELVPKYRCGDGGFDYYPGCQWGSNPRLTAYALEALLAARRFGYPVADREIDRAVAYLDRRLNQMEGALQERTSTLVALAEAGKPRADIEQAIFDARAGLTLADRADLARAMAFRLGPAAREEQAMRTLLAELDGGRREKDSGIVFADARDEDRNGWGWHTPQRTTALVLRALTQVDPGDGRIPLILRGLTTLDGTNRYWVTQETAQAVMALAEGVRVLKDRGATTTTATLSAAGDNLLQSGKVGAPLSTWTIPGEKIGAAIPVEITNEGSAPLFFGAFLSYAWPATARLPAKEAGFRVKRELLGQDGTPLPVQLRGGQSVVNLSVGELVRVRITLEADKAGQMVVVDDPLPAGLEAVDTGLATSDREASRRFGQSQRSWYHRYHRELRDDRVEWHFKEVAQGRFEVDYLARATTAGTWRAPGTSVERMYQPEIHGRALGGTVVVHAKAR